MRCSVLAILEVIEIYFATSPSCKTLGASVTDDRAKNKLTEEIQPTLPDSLKKTS